MKHDIETALLIADIWNLMKKHTYEVQCRAALAILDSVIVSEATDNDSLKVIVENCKDHVNGLLEKDIGIWKDQFGDPGNKE